MNVSLNEAEVMAKKAARGAGHAWGIAEEAGKATRWLCAHDIDGCRALARLLAAFDGADARDWSPVLDEEEWTAPGGTLCPLLAGAAVSDRAETLRHSAIVLARVAEPVLLFAFAAMAARQIEGAISVSWPDVDAVTDGENLACDGRAGAIAEQVSLRRGGALDRPCAIRHRATPDADAWEALGRFASRIYAPATEESRRRGAGAGLTDND